MRFRFALLSVLLATNAFAQSIGNYVLTANSSTPNLATPYTVIDVGSPATVAGPIGAVVIRSSRSVCTNAFKVKFFHHSSGTFTLYAERGPFDVNGALQEIVALHGQRS